ncbi:two-component system regulatory protein YycI [Vagococcus humatus]|uniref:Regulatory protein YycH-like domain-containing protein n=1 Tax=Vagococcus humatus TaxID=1889241 RepID=A0A429Z6P3_9ENTE|nr:two-component system regulatory protein YycI [Vagococcus humatus]RST89338.1 hypothetical protein C7P63_06075 [Vagococcus humatus]
MDFKKIERIFLLAFFFLNLFLLYTYRQGMSNDSAGLTESSHLNNIEQRLQVDNIKFPAAFSNEIHDGYYLSGIKSDEGDMTNFKLDGEIFSLDSGKMQVNLNKSVVVPKSKKESLKTMKELVKQPHLVPYGGEYQYQGILSDLPHKYVFTQQYNGIPIIDETSLLTINVDKDSEFGDNSLVNSYTQSHLREIEALRESQPLITERDAVTTLYLSNKIPKDARLNNIKLGYTRIFSVRGKNVYIPAWFVWIETSKKNSQIERVNAFTNSIISTSVTEVNK